MKQVNVVVCGGTFDHFHKGHKAFLSYALSLGERLIIGVTSDDYVEKSKIKNQKSKIESFEKRKEAILEFAEKEKVLNKTKVVKINDLFGPTLNRDFEIDAIVVSEETKKGAEIINKKRKTLGLKDLKIKVVPPVFAEDGKLISSERIRKGEINREGKLYVKPVWLETDLVLPENLREELKKPFGELLNIENLIEPENSLIITVGDITAKIFNEKSLRQNLSVIDFKVKREQKFTSIHELGFAGDEKVITAENPAGHITSDIFREVLKVFESDFKSKIILKITGEEDLAVLPLVLAAPLGTTIYYGQPGEGLVKVIASEEIKEAAYRLAGRFETF